MTITVCIHWFNPTVWIMYILFNRDIELACDERVIRQLGETSKSAYSLMLINMEAKRSGLLPFCSSFSKNAIEERITAIMRIRKTSILAISAAIMVVVGVSTVFVTSATGSSEEKSNNLITGFSDEEIDKLLALQFDGYEDMSISEYQNRVWKLTDTEEYRKLLDNFSQDTALYESKDSDETASFLFYTLEPLTAEKWRTRAFEGYAATDYPGASDNAMLEFIYTLTIQNADALTVREYNTARLGIMSGLQNVLQGKTDEELQDNAFMLQAVNTEIEHLTKQWSTDKLQISVEYSYMPLSELRVENKDTENRQQEHESRRYPNASKEDYRSLIALKTPDYQDMPVSDFNMALLDWANENYERMERINCDTVYHDFPVDLSSDEQEFVTVSARFSGEENAKYVQSSYTGQKEEDPSYNQYLPSKTDEQNGYGAWCDLFYQFSYHIPNKENLTIGERDDCVNSVINGIRNFWDETDLEQMLEMSEEDMINKLKEFAAEYSNDKIVVTIHEDSVSLERMDERNMELP